MKLRSFFSGLLALVIVLLLTGVGGLYWITAQSPLKLLAKGADRVPSAAIFVPKQAPAMVSLLVTPDELQAFRQVVAAPGQRRQTRTEFQQVTQSLLANTGLDFEKDVKPWLGDEVTFAITTLDIDRDPINGKQPGYLLAIASQSPQQAREFLQVFWQKRAIAGTDLTFEQYKGVKLIYNDVPIAPTANKGKANKKRPAAEPIANALKILPTESLASAVVGDQFILFANHPKVLRDAITNVQAPDLNLDSARFYAQTLDTLTQPRIGVSFINLPRVAEWLETESLTTATTASDTTKSSASQPLSQSQTLAIALGLDRQGLRIDTAMLEPGSKSAIAATLTKPTAALAYVPATSPIAAAGTDLYRFWTELSTTLNGYPTVAKLVTQAIQNFEQRQHLNLPQDIFKWVTEDYVLARVPDMLGTDAQPRKRRPSKGSLTEPVAGGDWIFVAERRAGDTTKTAIAHLDEIAKQQGYSIGAVQLGDQTVSAWTKLSSANPFSKNLQAEVQAVHTTVGQYELFATSLPAMEQALQATQHSLADRDRFQQAIAPLQTPNNGYLYLDWHDSQPILEQRFPFLKVIELAGQPLFNHLQSLAVSSYGRQDGVQRGAVFLKLT